MRIGTKSLLFGTHQILLHPIFVAAAWWKQYGAPLDPRLWIAFFVHDLGYFGKPNIDGPEGKTHPEFGAQIMNKLFGNKWGELCRYHSRSMARDHGREPSLLSHADKLATPLVPRWLYLRQINATGEIKSTNCSPTQQNDTLKRRQTEPGLRAFFGTIPYQCHLRGRRLPSVFSRLDDWRV